MTPERLAEIRGIIALDEEPVLIEACAVELLAEADRVTAELAEARAEVAALSGDPAAGIEGWRPRPHGWAWQPPDADEEGAGERAWCDRPDSVTWPRGPGWRWYYVPVGAKGWQDWREGVEATPRAAMRSAMAARREVTP